MGTELRQDSLGRLAPSRRSFRRGLAWMLALGLCLGGGAPAAAQGPAQPETPVYVIPGSVEAPNTGRSLSSGDVTGDGWQDVIVGGAGHIRVFSGKTGELWLDVALDPVPIGFGNAVASAGDVNGDGHEDIVAGAKGDTPSPGTVYLISGKNGSVLYVNSGIGSSEQLGQAVAGGVDLDGDGVPDYVAGGESAVRAYSGANGQEIWSRTDLWGEALCMLADVDGDGLGEVVASYANVEVNVLSGWDGSTLFTIPAQWGTFFGWALARVGDLDGDGIEDFAVSAPGSSTNGPIDSGRVDVYSGADGSLILSVHGTQSYTGLGGSLSSAGDVDGDGIPDLMANSGVWDPKVYIFSGATGSILYELRGHNYSQVTYPQFGSAVTGLGDLNGDGLDDFAVGYRGDHTYGTFAGSVYVYLADSADPVPHCQPKPNSQGCLPEISSSGLLSLSVGDAFHVRASTVINQQPGLLAWSTSPADQPFLGGTLCLQPPIVRTPVQSSGGNAGPSDCSGSYSFHFSIGYASQLGLQPGTTLYAQYWQRDPAHPDGTGAGLTNALDFTIHP